MGSSQQIIQLLETSKSQPQKVFTSDLAKKSIAPQFLEQLINCINEVNTTIETTSALPGHEHNAEIIENARKHMNTSIWQRIKGMDGIKENLLLKLLSIAIKSQRAGNCYEFSFFGQSLLEKAQVRTEVFRVKGTIKNANHVFLVSNRDPETLEGDFNTWNKEAIIIDPYMKKIYFASEIPTYLQSCVYDEETHTVSYIEFDEKEQTLDCDAKKEFIADWQSVIKEAQNPSEISPEPPPLQPRNP